MPFINAFKSGLNKLSKVAQAGLRKTGRGLAAAGRFAYRNRDLIAKAGATAAPIVAAGLVGGVPGAIGAALTQKEKIKGLVKDVEKRARGQTVGGDINQEDLKKIAQEAKPHVLKKIESARKKKLKELAQGQSV